MAEPRFCGADPQGYDAMSLGDLKAAVQAARPETLDALDAFLAAGDDVRAMGVIAYVAHGWDRAWPFTRMPAWLKDRYTLVEKEGQDG